MGDTAGRLLRLLGLLQRQHLWSGADLAARLEVDARTLRRDVQRLRALGYQVESVPGVAGGYRLGVGAELPPLLLDDDEATAVAVVLGVTTGMAVPGMERGALRALSKLDRLLPPRLRGQLAAMRASTVALLPPSDAVPADQLLALARACDSHQRVRFAYRARTGEQTKRRAEPHRLVATERRWYLVAYDLDRSDWRTFRVDRAESIELTGHTFVPRPLRDPGRLVAEAISTAPYRHRVVVALHAPFEEARRRVAPSVGVVSPAAGGEATVTLGTDEFAWLAGYLVDLDLGFEVLEPPELRQYLVDLGRQLTASHRGG